VSYKRSKVVRDAEASAASRCPPPCGKVRYITRASARRHANRIRGQVGTHLRVYSGDDSKYVSCHGFFHLRSYSEQGRVAFYREGAAFAAAQGLPAGWNVGVTREGRRWRYTVYVPGEEPMPSVHLYASAEIAQAEAVADILGESRTG
jgi:hypothetical protein